MSHYSHFGLVVQLQTLTGPAIPLVGIQGLKSPAANSGLGMWAA